MKACDSCGEHNPDRARYCLSCGAPLDGTAAFAPFRKTVTVVFSDVVGSTALGERLDPEVLSQVMTRYFIEMNAVLRAHGGAVAKFIGDAVVGVFGIPTLHEDDALRAIKAAWEMRASLPGLNAELEQRWGVSIAARIGVNTGEIAGEGAAPGQSLVGGDTANVAARLQQAAQPGEILLGDATWRLIVDQVTVEPLPPLSLKGKSGPVPAFRLLAVQAGRPAASRLYSPMVGRQSERALLELAFRREVQDRRIGLVTVVGPPGVGKSRLVGEFADQISEEAIVLQGRCLSYGEGITYWPVAEILRQAVRLTADDAGGETRSRVGSLLAADPDAAAVTERVGQVLGTTVGHAPAEEIFWAVRKVLEALAERRPVVTVLDDIHWGEPTFFDLLEHLLERSRDRAILLVCAARPEITEARPGWGDEATTISLRPLTPLESDVLISNLLGQATLDEQVKTLVAKTGQGFPLFVEQTLAMMIEEGVLREVEGRWVSAADPSKASIPPTISSLLAARLDLLDPEERALLGRASLVGQVFYWDAVAELTPEKDRGEVGRLLLELVRKELIRPERSDFSGQDAFRFSHVLIRDVAYASVPKMLRADLHEQFADWLEKAARDQLAESDEIVGYHLEQAYQYRIGLRPPDARARELARRAAGLLASAGLRAAARDDHHSAENLLSRCVHLWPREDLAGRARPRLRLVDVLISSGEFQRASALIEEGIQEARAAGDPALEARTQIRRTRLRARVDPKMSAGEAVRQMEEAAKVMAGSPNEGGLAEAWREIGFFRQGLGRYRDGAAALDRARALARQSHDRWLDPRVLSLDFSQTQGPETASEEIARARALLASGRGRRSEEAFAHLSLALHLAMQGAHQEARAHADSGSAILEDLGSKFQLAAAATLTRAQVEMLAGDPAAAGEHLRPGIEVLKALGASGLLTDRAAFMARILYEQGRDDEALEFVGLADRSGAPDDIETQLWFRGVQAKILARRGATQEAERLGRETVEMAERTDWLNFQGDAYMDLAEVLRLIGRPDEAAQAIHEGIKRFDLKGNHVSAGRARGALEELRALKPRPS